MLRFFQSLFGSGAAAGGHPNALVKRAIERAVDGTDPWIRAVSGYQKKLRPCVVRSIDHVVALAEQLAPALSLDPARYGSCPLLRTLFVSPAELATFLANDPALQEFRNEHPAPKDAPSLHALLLLEKQERSIMGVALSGEIVMRDVAQVSVSFQGHRLVDVCAKEEETSRLVKRRAYDHLLKLALGRLTELKTRRGKLEKHRTLLRSKLDLLQREGWGFDEGTGGRHDVAAVEAELGSIENQLMEVGGDDRMLEAYLGIVMEVLGHPEAYLWGQREGLIVDRMGIKRGEASADAPEVPLDMVHNAEGRSMVVTMVTVPGAVIFGS